MASQVILKKSSVAARVPVVGDLAFGELALNYQDGLLYYKKADGTTIGSFGSAGVGTVTSVAALTLGTTGTDVSSTVATGTTTPVITLNIPTASVTNRGALSALDWTTFNGKQAALGFTPYNATNPSGYTANTGTVTGVTATAPVVSSGGTAPVLSMAAATSVVNGYMTLTYAAKLDGIAAGATANTGTVTGVTATAPVVSSGGTAPVLSMAAATSVVNGYMTLTYAAKLDGIAAGATANTGTVTGVTATAPVVSSGGTAPVLSMAAATTLVPGYLTAADWNTFNGKQAAGTYLSSSNYNSYSPTLTGGSASGTWGISITGNSATVSNIIANTGLLVNNLVAPALIDGLTTGNFRSTMFGTASNGNALSTSRWNSTPAPFSGLSSYGTAISWAGSDTHGFLALNYSTAGAIIGGGSGQAIQWSATLLHSSNYNSYSPTLTGGSASGTWGINITGTAGSLSASSTISSYMGDSGVLFQSYNASASNSAQFNISHSLGAVTISNARGALTLNGNITGTAGSISGYNNPTTASTANTIVYRDGNGYIQNSYFYTSSGGAERNASGMAYFSGHNSSDYYIRSYTPAAAATAMGALTTSNYTSYSPTLTGGSASGTWGISITGSAPWGNITSKPGGIMYYQGFTLDANTMDSNATGFTYALNAPWTGPIARFSTGGGYDLWLNGNYSGGGNTLSFRTRNGDAGTYNSWKQILHDGNYTSYSPTLTGGSASGTWGISVTGSATSVTGGLKTINGTSIIGSGDIAVSVANFTSSISSSAITPDSPPTINTLGYAAQAGLPFSQTDGGLYSAGYSTSWYHQIYGDFRSGQIAVRGKNSGTWQAWRAVLDASNYTSYSPTLTGGSASGTWGINITGSAGSAPANGGTATYATYLARTGSAGNLNTDFNNTAAGTYQFKGDDAGITNNPGGTWWFHENFRHSNGSSYWGTQVSWGWEDNSNRLMQRNVSAGTWSGWVEYLNTGGRTFSGSLTMSGNITAYSDETLKKDWSPVIHEFISLLSKVKSGSYTRIDSNERQAGVSAQDIKNILPETVLTDADGKLSIAYGNAALVSAVELAKEVMSLNARIARLEALVSKLIEG